jgi:hypothetical protein
MQGLLHLLGDVGLLHGSIVPDAPPTQTRLMAIGRNTHYVYAYVGRQRVQPGGRGNGR